MVNIYVSVYIYIYFCELTETLRNRFVLLLAAEPIATASTTVLALLSGFREAK